MIRSAGDHGNPAVPGLRSSLTERPATPGIRVFESKTRKFGFFVALAPAKSGPNWVCLNVPLPPAPARIGFVWRFAHGSPRGPIGFVWRDRVYPRIPQPIRGPTCRSAVPERPNQPAHTRMSKSSRPRCLSSNIHAGKLSIYHIKARPPDQAETAFSPAQGLVGVHRQ